MNHSLGRYVYGLAAIGSGVCGLVWHDVGALAGAPHRAMLSHVVGGVEVLGGLAALWPGTVRAGAAALGVVYCAFALLAVPEIFAHPLVYNSYGNCFEQLSMAAGGVILFAWARAGRLAWFGYYAFGICMVSFALEQYFYLRATAQLVPGWMPMGRMFWAWATTVAFGLGAVSLLTRVCAQPAARLTGAMLAGFALLTWAPIVSANPHNAFDWSEGMETLVIAGVAWVVGDFLGQRAAAPRG